MKPGWTRWSDRLFRPQRSSFTQTAVEQSILRANTISLCIAILASICVYFFHDSYHSTLLPMLHIGSALGDALGGLIIILVANAGVRLASLAVYRDKAYGLMRTAGEAERSREKLLGELKDADRQAGTDKLTNCLNRHRFDSVISAEMDRMHRHGHSLSFILIDIDHFKSVNDTHGHGVGDTVLISVAQSLHNGLRASDYLIRWGGEEFLVLCPETALRTALILAERLRSAVGDTPVAPVGAVTISIGVAQCLDTETWAACLERADAALYRAKDAGRNQVQHAPETPVAATSQNLLQLHWCEEYRVGHQLIDRQHMALFTLANELISALADARNAATIQDLIDRLVAEVKQHFIDEESVLSSYGFTGLAEHAASHASLLDKATRLADNYRQGQRDVGAVLRLLTRDLIEGHVLHGDQQYAPLIAASGRAPN